MKLLICLKCGDIFSLSHKEKSCGCGRTKGQYIDELNAEISGPCKGIGFANQSFRFAYTVQKVEDAQEGRKPDCCRGVEFDAFFIPEVATSVRRIDEE